MPRSSDDFATSISRKERTAGLYVENGLKANRTANKNFFEFKSEGRYKQ